MPYETFKDMDSYIVKNDLLLMHSKELQQFSLFAPKSHG